MAELPIRTVYKPLPDAAAGRRDYSYGESRDPVKAIREIWRWPTSLTVMLTSKAPWVVAKQEGRDATRCRPFCLNVSITTCSAC